MRAFPDKGHGHHSARRGDRGGRRTGAMTGTTGVTDSTPAIAALEAAGVPFEVVRTERASQRRGERGAPGHPGRGAPAHDRRPARRGRLPVRPRARRPPLRLAEAARPSRGQRLSLPDADEAQAGDRLRPRTRSRRSARPAPGRSSRTPRSTGSSVVAIGGGDSRRQPPPRPGRPRPRRSTPSSSTSRSRSADHRH